MLRFTLRGSVHVLLLGEPRPAASYAAESDEEVNAPGNADPIARLARVLEFTLTAFREQLGAERNSQLLNRQTGTGEARRFFVSRGGTRGSRRYSGFRRGERAETKGKCPRSGKLKRCSRRCTKAKIGRAGSVVPGTKYVRSVNGITTVWASARFF